MTSTPRLTDHARQRCYEMDVPTRRAKGAVQSPQMTYPVRDGRLVAISHDEPRLAVVFEEGEPAVIVTVLAATFRETTRGRDGGVVVVNAETDGVAA